MKCLKCGADLPEGVYFCGECGSPVQNGGGQPSGGVYGAPAAYEYTGTQASVCPHCGNRVASDAAFCAVCGNRINAPQPPVNQYQMPHNQPQMQPVQSQKSNTPLFVLLGVIGFLIVIAIVVILVFALNNRNVNNPPAATAVPIVAAAPTEAPQPTQLPAQPAQPAQPAAPAAPPAAPPQRNTQPTTGGYLFPSDYVYISEADLAGRSKDEVRLILNEIYARHGYIFSTQSYQSYFASKSWYVPISSSQSEIESRFNSIELANKNFISNYEKQRGWR